MAYHLMHTIYSFIYNLKKDYMKKVIMAVLLISATLFFTACGGDSTTDTSNTNSSKDSTDSTRGDKPADTMSPQTVNTPPSQESIDFVNKAATGGMMEVEAGKLAQQNAKSQRVKDFGSMMVTDHSQANEELKSLASANNVTVPTALPPEHQKHIDMMSKMKGDAFDKHYMSMMVNDHKKVMAEFEKEANGETNDPFKAFAAKTLPTLKKHLDSANAINGKK